MSGSRVVITAEIGQALREFQRFRAQATSALEAVNAVGGKLSGMMGAAVLGMSVGAFAGWIKGAIDATDAASDLSQKTGIAIKDLAGLELAYQMGGMEAEAMASTQTKLSKAIVDGNSGLERLGISSKNLDGSMKSNRQVLGEVADRFVGMEDGAAKTALAMEIFGKSGADMIPMLNGGSAGLQEMDEMAAKLGLTLSEETVEQAGSFNDTLDLLKLGGQGVARGIAAELLPTLTKLTGSFLQSMMQGDRLKNTAHYLSLGLKGLYSIGVGIVEVFLTVGKVIWGLAEIMVNNLKGAIDVLTRMADGDFKGAWDSVKRTVTTNVGIGVDAAKSIGAGWSSAWTDAVGVWDEGGDKMVETMAKVAGASTKVGKSAAEVKKQTEAANKERAEETKILAALSGFTVTYEQDLARLNAMRAKGNLTEAQHLKLVAELKAQQPGAKAALEAETKARKELAEFDQEYLKSRTMVSDMLGQFVEDAEKEAEQQEALARVFGLTAVEVQKLELARLQEQLAQRSANALTLDEIETLERLIAAKQRSIAAAGRIGELEQVKKLAEEGKRASDSIQQSLTDALMRGFESGSGFAENLATTVKNMFKTMVLRPVVSAIVNPVAGAVTNALGLSGSATAAAGAGGGLGSIVGAASNAYSMLSGGMTLGGGLGTGFMGSIAGGLNGAGIGSGLTSSMGLAIGESISSVVGTSVASGISSAMSMAAAAMPWLAGLGVAVAVWKKLDTSGTYHAGGAASATASGITAVSAKSLNMEKIQTNADTQKMVGQLAQGIVGILDSTAVAFGKTAGYQAATAFADDTSKDGAWGSLVISKLGQSVVNWQDTRGNGKWSQKTFADGAKGQEQYLAALTGSVRTALDSIGLPEWAKTMLSGVASDASLDDLAKVVAQINVTQAALKTMGDNITGFASMSDAAVSKLIAAAGGIEGLSASASSYFQNFYTEGEKLARTGDQVAEALAAVGLQMPTSRAAYRALVEQQMALGEAGAPAVAVLLRLNETVAALLPEVEATNDALRSQADILSERTNLQKELDQLTMTTAQQRAKEREALDASNRALYDQVIQQRDLKASTEATTGALRDTVERLTATRDGALGYRDSLMTGSLSTLSPMDKYFETQRQYNEQVQKALANPADSAAASAAQAAATAWLTASQVVNASSSAFVGDRNKVLGDMGQLAAIAGVQMTDAQLQLSALDKQVAGIDRLNTTAAGIEQALINQGIPVSAAAPVLDLQRYSAGSNAAADVLATEVKALRADNAGMRNLLGALLDEAKGRRRDAERQTEAMTGATEDAGEDFEKSMEAALEEVAHIVANPSRVAPR